MARMLALDGVRHFALSAALAAAALWLSAPLAHADEQGQAEQSLEDANKALEDAARELEDAQRALDELDDVEPQAVIDACEATFALPQHVATCQEAVRSRMSEGPPAPISYADLESRYLAVMEMSRAGPVGAEQNAAQTPAQRIMWGIIYEEDSSMPERLCSHPDAPKVPGQLDLPPKSQEQVAGADPQFVPGMCTDPAAWAEREVESRAAEREKAQQEILKPAAE